jgi:hypothetical protein
MTMRFWLGKTTENHYAMTQEKWKPYKKPIPEKRWVEYSGSRKQTFFGYYTTCIVILIIYVLYLGVKALIHWIF